MKNFFETEYKVIVSDINYGGHMGNERALIIFQQTRMEWLNSIGSVSYTHLTLPTTSRV